MRSLILTGGIATGKSLSLEFARSLLSERLAVFDCDAAAHELLTKAETGRTLGARFGSEVLDEAGLIDRSRLRAIVLSDSAKRVELQELLHPTILEMALKSWNEAQPNQTADSGPDYFIFDVPLFYEVDFPVPHDRCLVVGTTEQTQIERLRSNRDLDDQTIQQFLSSQLPIDEKLCRADHVLWNGGSKKSTQEQVALLFDWLDSSEQSHE